MAEYSRAIEDFDKALELRPDIVSAYRNRGDSHKELGAFQRAIADYNKAIDLVPTSFAAHFGRGLVYAALGDHLSKTDVNRARDEYRRAIDDLNKALTLTEDSANRADVEKALAELQQ